MRPEDFTLMHKWMEGSLPPPHHYEYEIIISLADKGEIIFHPDYPSEGTPTWIEEFHIDNATIVRLYDLLVEKEVFSQEWKDKEDTTIGGELEWMEGIANKVHFEIPSSIEKSEIIDSLYIFIRSLVPEKI